MTPPQDQIQITLNHVLNLIKLWLERKQFPQNILLLVRAKFHYNKTLEPVWNLLLHKYLIYKLLLNGAVGKLLYHWTKRRETWAVAGLPNSCAPWGLTFSLQGLRYPICQISKLNELGTKFRLSLNSSDSKGSHISADFKILVFMKLNIL